MAKRNNHHVGQYRPNDSHERGLLSLADSCLSSANPAKWVAGVLIGTLAVVGLGLEVMSRLDNGR